MSLSIPPWRLSGRTRLIAILCILLGLTCSLHATPATFVRVNKGATSSTPPPNGYWEYLPSAYYDNPGAKLPLLIFFHGAGEGGSGTGSGLDPVLRNGPPKVINANVQTNVFQTNNAIVLCPQTGSTSWWNETSTRNFLSYALTQYAARIDTSRIYFTGLSAGAYGVKQFIELDANVDQVTAFLTCAERGFVSFAGGAKWAELCPYWSITARYDGESETLQTLNGMAGYLAGTGSPTNLLSNYPGQSVIRTGLFQPDTGWVWQDGVVGTDGPNPRLTYIPGDTNNHDTWIETYELYPQVYTWLFTQQKPAITSLLPADGTVSQPGQLLNLTATAVDRDGNAVTKMRWYSNLDGFLGSGTSIGVSNLTIGVHRISCLAIDTKCRSVRKEFTVTVPYAGAYRILTDFGPAGSTTPGNWNHITNQTIGKIDNAIDTRGMPVGVRIEITSRFDNTSTGGSVASFFYPSSAQSDCMFASSLYPTPKVTISGLNPTQTYDFTFFGSRAIGDGMRMSRYSIDGQSVTLNAANNTNARVTLHNMAPDATGKVVVMLDRPGSQDSSHFAYFSVMSIASDGVVAAIDCGTSTPTIASDGIDYSIDNAFTGGAAGTLPEVVGGTSDSDLHRSYRQGNFTYAIPVPNGNYLLTLRFADEDVAAGARVFSITGETYPLLTAMDIRAAAGAFQALSRIFYVSVSDGTLNLAINNGAANGRLSAIVLKKANAGQQAYFSWRAGMFSGAQQHDPAIAGLDADPEKDGRSNLEEFALGGNPMAADAVGAPGVNGQEFTYEFSRRDPLGAGYRILYSDDSMEGWTEFAHINAGETTWSGSQAASVSEGASVGGFRPVTVNLAPLLPSSAAFLKVQVLEP